MKHVCVYVCMYVWFHLIYRFSGFTQHYNLYCFPFYRYLGIVTLIFVCLVNGYLVTFSNAILQRRWFQAWRNHLAVNYNVMQYLHILLKFYIFYECNVENDILRVKAYHWLCAFCYSWLTLIKICQKLLLFFIASVSSSLWYFLLHFIHIDPWLA